MKSIFIFSFLISFLIQFPAFAATLCANITYWDEREDFHANSKLTTVELDKPARRQKIWIYDLNGSCIDFHSGCTENNDVFINTVYTDTNGEFCTTVGNFYDIYLVHKTENIYGKVRKNTTNEWVRSSLELAPDINGTVSVNWSVTCYFEQDGLCNNSNFVTSNYLTDSYYLMILESIYDTANYFDSTGVLNINGINYSDGQEFIGYYPGYDDGTDVYCQSANQTWSNQKFCIKSGHAYKNHVVAHEIGHILHRRSMNIANSSPVYFLSENSCGTSLWDDTTGGEKCTLVEGFANFVATSVYWQKNIISAWYSSSSQKVEGNTTHGNSSSLPCVSNNSSPEKSEGNATRFFWDLFDSTNENESYLEDDSDLSFYNVVNVWSSFNSGTSNRQNKETGNNGRNAYDYQFHYTSSSSELIKNCLTNQSP